jgi:hypothetical protein
MKPPIREPSLSPTSSSLTRPPSCFDGYETNSPTRRPNSFDGYETIPPMARPPRTMRRSLQSCSDATSTDFEFWWERRSRSCAWLARHPSLIPEMCTAFEVAEQCSRIIFQWIDRSIDRASGALPRNYSTVQPRWLAGERLARVASLIVVGWGVLAWQRSCCDNWQQSVPSGNDSFLIVRN